MIDLTQYEITLLRCMNLLNLGRASEDRVVHFLRELLKKYLAETSKFEVDEYIDMCVKFLDESGLLDKLYSSGLKKLKRHYNWEAPPSVAKHYAIYLLVKHLLKKRKIINVA